MSDSDTSLDRSKPLSERLARFAGNTPSAPVCNHTQKVSRLAVRPGEVVSRGTVWALLDTSGSMEGGALSQAKRGLEDFSRQAIATGFSIGILSFDDDCRIVSEATNKIQSIVDSLAGVNTGSCTMMSPPFRLATQRLCQAKGERIIFLVTDGQASDPEDTLAAAAETKKSGIDIMTLGVEGADQQFLRQLCTRADLACTSTRAQLQVGISKAARLLLG